MRKVFFLIGVLFLLTGSLSAQGISFLPGSWQFNVLTGDSAAQLSFSGDTEFSAQLLIDNNGFITNNQDSSLTTSDTQYYGGRDGIIATGSVSENTVNVAFTTTNGNGSTSQYSFTGTLATNAGVTTISGTYTATASDVANCQQTYCISQYVASGGNFIATYFPPLFGGAANTYNGDFQSPDVIGSPGPDNVPANLTFTGQDQGNATGTITLPNGMTSPTGQACFTNWPDGSTLHFDSTTLGPDPHGIDSGDWQSGFGTIFWARDNSSPQVQVYLNSYSMADCTGTEIPACATNPLDPPDSLNETLPAAAGNYVPLAGGPPVLFDGGRWNGTNNEVYISYAITGGPCDGYGGGDSPFVKTGAITKKDHGKHLGQQKHRRNRFLIHPGDLLAESKLSKK